MTTAADFDVVGVVARAVALDVESASPSELWWADRAADRVRAWLDAWQAEVEFHMTLPPPLPADPAPVDEAPAGEAASGGDGVPGSLPGAEPLPSLGSSPPAQASPQEMLRKARRARLLADLPSLRDALAAGRITLGHVDLLATAVERLDEAIRIRVLGRGEELLRAACASSPDRFSRAVHRVIAKAYDDEGVDRARRRRSQSGLHRGVDEATGMRWLRLDLDPERGAELFQRLDHEREAIYHAGGAGDLRRDQVELQALLNLLGAPGAQQRSSTKKAHVAVIIDIETLAIGAHDRSVCETWSGAALPPDTVRNLICAAEVSFGFAIKGRVVLHLANAELATADQRRELRMTYRTCMCCDTPFDRCQIHHIVPRSRGGPTTTPLLGPLCTVHHDRIHHEGWTLAIDEHRNVTLTAPDGTEHERPYVPLADHGQPSLFDPDPAAA